LYAPPENISKKNITIAFKIGIQGKSDGGVDDGLSHYDPRHG
jgi:prolyl oligopeptidase PreP (S9A serine peptidase family)